jgi:Flp pilus assembly protein TadD
MFAALDAVKLGRSKAKAPRVCPVRLKIAVCFAVTFSSTISTAGEGDRISLPEGYLVVPFENDSTLKALDWMASALAVMTAEKLEVLPGLRPAYGPGILSGLPTSLEPDKVAARARELGAKWVVGGRFSRPNWKPEVTIRIYAVVEPSGTIVSPTLRLVAEASGVGERDHLLELFNDQLVAAVKKAGFSVPSEMLVQLLRRPTRDLYALTLFGRALNFVYGIGGAKDLAKALPIFKKVNLIDPKFAEAHRMLGWVLLTMGERSRAVSQYLYALDLKPGYYAALSGLARLYRAEGNRVRAEELLEKALELRPYDTEARQIHGELLWEKAQLDEALSELRKVTALEPRNVQARRTLALIYAAKGGTGEMAVELERVQELLPDDIEVKIDLASAYQRMGDTNRAIATYEEALRRQPKNLPALKFLGDCYRRRGDLGKAILAYQRVMKLAPEDPRPYFLLGATYEEAGQEGKAEQVFLEAQQFRRYLGETWTNLGAIAYRRGDLSKATWYLSRAVARAPTRPKAHYNYALLLSAKKERDRALDELTLASELDPEDSEIRYLAGVILLRQGRLDEAKARFQEALLRRPDHEDAKHNLALLLDLERRYGAEHSASGAE